MGKNKTDSERDSKKYFMQDSERFELLNNYIADILVD